MDNQIAKEIKVAGPLVMPCGKLFGEVPCCVSQRDDAADGGDLRACDDCEFNPHTLNFTQEDIDAFRRDLRALR